MLNHDRRVVSVLHGILKAYIMMKFPPEKRIMLNKVSMVFNSFRNMIVRLHVVVLK